jgi:hypothetical protein
VVFKFFFWFCLFFLLSLCVSGAMEKEDRSNRKKGGERRRERLTWEVTRRGESLAIYPPQTNNGSRGLLPSPWALDYTKGLLPSPRFSSFYFIFLLFISLFYFFFQFWFLFFCWFFLNLFLAFQFFGIFRIF